LNVRPGEVDPAIQSIRTIAISACSSRVHHEPRALLRDKSADLFRLGDLFFALFEGVELAALCLVSRIEFAPEACCLNLSMSQLAAGPGGVSVR